MTASTLNPFIWKTFLTIYVGEPYPNHQVVHTQSLVINFV